MPRIVQSPKRGLNLLSIDKYNGRPLAGHSIGGIVSTDYPPSIGPKTHTIFLEETGSVNTERCVLRVVFSGAWRDITAPRVKPMDRLYLSGPGIKVDPDHDGDGVFCLRVSTAAPPGLSPAQIEEAAKKGLAELGQVVGVAVQWDPVSPHSVSSFTLSHAAADDRVALHAGPNKVFLPARFIGAHELSDLPASDDREQDVRKVEVGGDSRDAFGFTDGTEADAQPSAGQPSAATASTSSSSGSAAVADAGPMPSPSPVHLQPPLRSPGCHFLSELREGDRNRRVWGVVVKWKPATPSQGSDCTSQLTIIDDSHTGQGATASPSSRVCSVNVKLFSDKLRPFDAIQPVSVGDIVYLNASTVSAYRGNAELIGYKDNTGGTLLPADPAAAAAALIPCSASHFGVYSADGRFKREGSEGPGTPLTMEERARVEQLRAWFRCISQQGYSLPNSGNYMKRFAELRERTLGASGAFVDVTALVLGTGPVYKQACQAAAQMDARVLEAGGPGKVLGGPAEDPYRKELQEWVRSPEIVLKRKLLLASTAADNMELYLWDGSDPGVVDPLWQYMGGQGDVGQRAFAWTGSPDKASGTIMRLTVKSLMVQVARLQLQAGDWVCCRNLRIVTDQRAYAGEALEAQVIAVEQKYTCSIMRLPVPAPFSAPLSLGPMGVGQHDVRQSLVEYVRYKYEQLGAACGIVGAERWQPGFIAVHGMCADVPAGQDGNATHGAHVIEAAGALAASAAPTVPAVQAPPAILYDWVTRVSDPTYPLVTVQQLKGAIRGMAADVQAGRIQKGDFLGRWAIAAKAVAVRPDNWLDLCIRDDSLPARPWAYQFSMHVHCIKEGPLPRTFAEMKEDNLLHLYVAAKSAEQLLPDLPPCNLRANPYTACAVANRLGVLARPPTALNIGVAVLFEPDFFKTVEPKNSDTVGTQATQADWGQYVLDSCAFLIVDTFMNVDKGGHDALEHGAKAVKWAHGPDCPCLAWDEDAGDLITTRKRSRLE